MADNEQVLDVTLDDDNEELNVDLESFFVPVQQDIVHIDTTAHWNAQSQLIAESGHVYVYLDYTIIDDEPIPAIKVGDGTSYLIDMPFVAGNDELWNEHINNTVIHVTAADKVFWNNKVTCFLSAVDAENLVFTTAEGE